MSTIDTPDRPTSEPAARHALPDPGASVPGLALPTLGVYFGALTVFVISTIAYTRGLAPAWATIPVNALVTFWMFTVVHDASHYAISSKRWVNALFGRLAWIFVVPIYAFPAFAYLHIEHHRHFNDVANDPDTFPSPGRPWLLPFRWALAEVYYGGFYLRRARSRPRTEIAETELMFTSVATWLLLALAPGNRRS